MRLPKTRERNKSMIPPTINDGFSYTLLYYGDWISFLTRNLTKDHPSKFVRVLGALGVLVLLPLLFIGIAMIFLSFVVAFFEDI